MQKSTTILLAVVVAPVVLGGAIGEARAQTPQETREAIRTLMARPAPPTTEEFFYARLQADGAVHKAPGEPWGYAAHVDIARRWGDPEMLARRLEDLDRHAPGHPETLRTIAEAGRRARWPIVLGWLCVALVIGVTFFDAARSTWRRRAASRPAPAPAPAPRDVPLPLVLLAAVVVPLAFVSTALAAQPMTFPIDDADPEAQIPSVQARNAAPLAFADYLEDVIERAATATKRGDHGAAVRYYRALAKAVPERSTAFVKLCESLEAAGRREEALDACRAALSRDGVVARDHARFVHLLLSQPGLLASKDVEDARAVVAHLVSQTETRVVAYQIECEVGVRLVDTAMLEDCTAGLATVAPADPKTLTFRWALAMSEGRGAEASGLVAEARAAGVGADVVEKMEHAMAASRPAWQRMRGTSQIVFSATLVALVVAGILVYARRRRSSSTPGNSPASYGPDGDHSSFHRTTGRSVPVRAIFTRTPPPTRRPGTNQSS